ncbi:MAG: PaaI family thioesterase [Solirubrobacteraceae bacterium]
MEEQKYLTILNAFGENNFQKTLGLTFTSLNLDELTCEADFIVKKELSQPMGLINGGASAGVMETVGSALTSLFVNFSVEYNLGLSLNVSHIKSAKIGEKLTAYAKIIHKGRKTHIIKIDIKNIENKLISTGTLTNMIISN